MAQLGQELLMSSSSFFFFTEGGGAISVFTGFQLHK